MRLRLRRAAADAPQTQKPQKEKKAAKEIPWKPIVFVGCLAIAGVSVIVALTGLPTMDPARIGFGGTGALLGIFGAIARTII